MNLRGLVSVTGKPGLYRLIGQNKSGFIIEGLENPQNRNIVNLSTTKMATLEDITIFGVEEEIRLIDVLEKIKATELEIPEAKADGKILREFFTNIQPDHDESRVYASDIKKIISWYHIIKNFPLFDEEEPAPLQFQQPTSEEGDIVAEELKESTNA